MPEYDLEEVARQRRLLADDVPSVVDQVRPGWAEVQRQVSVRRALAVGSGDSWAAGQAASIALAEGGVLMRTEAPTSVLARGLGEFADLDLAVVVSASGENETCVAVAQRLGRAGLPIVAVTGDRGSPLARTADHTIAWQLPGRRPCPGVRTYQANLLTLMAMAASPEAPFDGAAVAGIVERSHGAHQELVDALVPLVLEGPDPRPPVVTALGAHVASARYVAAKVVETAGLFARADDLEEWWHVARFAEPLSTPLVVLDLPAGGAGAGEELVNRAKATGRPVVRAMSAAAAGLPERWWPLWHLGLGVDLGLALARRRGVRPFAR